MCDSHAMLQMQLRVKMLARQEASDSLSVYILKKHRLVAPLNDETLQLQRKGLRLSVLRRQEASAFLFSAFNATHKPDLQAEQASDAPDACSHPEMTLPTRMTLFIERDL